MRIVGLLVVLSLATPAIAQERSRDVPATKLIISERAIAEGMAAHAPSANAAAQANQRDSVKNGMIIGALVGALAMGAGAGLLCKALQEPTDPSCWKSVGVGGLYGAGIGVAAGAGIDALFVRQPQATRRRR